MTYESVSFTQAVRAKYARMTFERKIMSTKTSIKRVALVAVAALGFGMVTAVASNAAVTNDVFAPTVYSGTLTSVAAGYTVDGHTASPAGYVQLTAQSNVSGATNLTLSVTGGSISSVSPAYKTWTCTGTGSQDYSGTTYGSSISASGVITDGSKLLSSAISLTSANTNVNCGSITTVSSSDAYVRIATPVAGTINATLSKNSVNGSGISSTTVLETFTIIVTGGSSYTGSIATLTAGSASDAYKNTVDGVVYAAKADVSGAAANVTIVQYAGSTAITDSTKTKAVTVTLTGVGSLSDTVVGASYAAWSATDAALSAGGGLVVPVYADGRAGTATVAVTVDGVAVSTKTIKFYGSAAKIVATGLRTIGLASSAGAENGTVVSGGTASSPSDPASTNAPAIAVLVTDALGTPVPTAVVGKSSDATVVSNAKTNALLDSGDGDYSVGTYYQHITYTTSALGTSGKSATLTYSITLADGTVITSNPVTVTLGGAAASVTMATNASSYLPGEQGTITITAKDAAGNAAYDGSTLFSAVTANTTLFGGSIPTTSTAVLGGTKTLTFTAPVVAGEWTITATLADGTTKVVLPVTVAKDTEAIDAANEATDAANAATDAANAAAEAADAATAAAQDAQAAVAALATQVASLIAGIKAQITTLTNLIIKIQKKLKA